MAQETIRGVNEGQRRRILFLCLLAAFLCAVGFFAFEQTPAFADEILALEAQEIHVLQIAETGNEVPASDEIASASDMNEMLNGSSVDSPSESAGIFSEQATEESSDEEEGAEPFGYRVYSFSGEDLLDAQINQSCAGSDRTILDDQVPLGNFERTTQINSTEGSGSIFNTALAMLVMLSMLVMLLLIWILKTRDYRVIALRTIASTLGLVVVTMWALLDKLQAPTELFNEASLLLAVFFLLYTALAITSYLYENYLKKALPDKDNTPIIPASSC